MSHQVALAFEDGVTRFITCTPDQTVADASYRARINIPMDCRDGVCGTCKAFCDSGEFDGGSYLPDALSSDEEQDGYVLTCQMKPRSDLALQIACTSAVAKTSAATFRGTVTGLDRLSPTTVALTIEIADREKLVFLPGQYVNIAVPGTEESRSYSFSNAPADDALTFLVKITPGGVMSTYLDERAEVGDAISFTGPHGSFFLREAPDPLLLLAGGTGLAPILAILRTLAAAGSERPVHLLYGATTDDDVVEIDTIAGLADAIPGMTWTHCVADRRTTAPHQGYVTALIEPEHLHDGTAAVYLCGPPPMVDGVRSHFSDQGMSPGGFFYEKFALAAVPDGEAPAEEAEEVEEPAAVDVRGGDGEELLVLAGEGRAITGQVLAPLVDLAPLHASNAAPAPSARGLCGQEVFALSLTGDPAALDAGDDLILAAGRSLAGQEVFPTSGLEPLAAPVPTPPPAGVVGEGGYEIGEEHPSVHESDAIFDARRALELGALELVIGRLTGGQVNGYRLLAEATVPYVEDDRFVDAAGYTESNAAFHDYLFSLTRNEHLSQAYRALGVRGHMEQSLRTATWCHPLCTQDHLDIVDAIEAGDRERARQLVSDHADRSKETTRRAMADNTAKRRPRFVTPGRFEGRVVVVTGAAQGIGRTVAERAAAEGGLLVLVDRSPLVHEVAEGLLADGAKTLAVEADLEQWAGAESALREAQAWQGRVDVLVNNVGGAINFKPFVEFTEAEISAEIQRSLMPTLWCCRAVLPGMVQRTRGVIVNVSSAATRGVHRIPYSAAKGGINAITASLAVEYAEHGIRVVATAPGGTEAPPRRISRGTPEAGNEQERAWFQAHVDQTLGSSLLGRYGTLDEQAAAILFLASDEASYVTGTVLPVAGGDMG
ncbi:benzoate 1,2-dioxygenase electron transfer component BenC [Pseudonocardia abyssalis]|uniref:1,6-dihydroxycyclohexa-2,4-diene-1-carboxylate dehydrogenase n=1 Tax=Pseudonocardia abyssalis TaxID=2792008 RepID=A0ABS6UNY1_9PSEU|nr:benzoate 1,2-dioxygenase electron transfer component BenC [Pseudonocardia abyssalis]MBW0115230.1 1,6-dihydroxycyclohexa-2,4-diene-1-carboxylate dehydrogenase [Pseudonocardia abyssalis]MBW0133932.1 1,6-dihydroxycyclohexa-2,4-diene-1-carboxylate dehydrogenase [Pseudonocardia abyssalis]